MYIYTHIHTYVHTYIRTYIHYIHKHIHKLKSERRKDKTIWDIQREGMNERGEREREMFI